MGGFLPGSPTVRTADQSQLVIAGAAGPGKVLTGTGPGAAAWGAGGGGGDGARPLAMLETSQFATLSNPTQGIWGYTVQHPGNAQPEGWATVDNSAFRYRPAFGPGFAYDPFDGMAGYAPPAGWWQDSGYGALQLLTPGWYEVIYSVSLWFSAQPTWCYLYDGNGGSMSSGEQSIPIAANRTTGPGTHIGRGYYRPGPFKITGQTDIQPTLQWQGGVDLAAGVGGNFLKMQAYLLSVD